MSALIRQILFKLLGLRSYLNLVSGIYIRMIRAGFLKTKYPELHYISSLVQPGWNCIDIGANVGYYSVFISKACTKSGRVYAVEPVSLFAHVFIKNTERFGLDNITLYPVALGDENKKITMGTPSIKGVFRHGLTHVLNENENRENMETSEADMRIPDELFADISHVNFIKCDVEGYERFIMPAMKNIIQKHLPVIQIEITPEDNRKLIYEMLKPMGYKAYKLLNYQFYELSYDEMLRYHAGDFYFQIG